MRIPISRRRATLKTVDKAGRHSAIVGIALGVVDLGHGRERVCGKAEYLLVAMQRVVDHGPPPGQATTLTGGGRHAQEDCLHCRKQQLRRGRFRRHRLSAERRTEQSITSTRDRRLSNHECSNPHAWVWHCTGRSDAE